MTRIQHIHYTIIYHSEAELILSRVLDLPFPFTDITVIFFFSCSLVERSK